MTDHDPYQCITCGLVHRKVEAGGIYYCPNPLCRVCGAAWFRASLPSMKENSNGTHTVDAEEWVLAAYAVDISDAAISEARDRMSDKYFGGYRPPAVVCQVIEGVKFP